MKVTYVESLLDYLSYSFYIENQSRYPPITYSNFNLIMSPIIITCDGVMDVNFNFVPYLDPR